MVDTWIVLMLIDADFVLLRNNFIVCECLFDTYCRLNTISRSRYIPYYCLYAIRKCRYIPVCSERLLPDIDWSEAILCDVILTVAYTCYEIYAPVYHNNLWQPS